MARRPVDEKIIKLSMDNSDLVSKAAESSSLLTKFTGFLNKIPGVNLGKTAQELQNIGKATPTDPVSKLGDAVQNVSDRFSTMGIIGATVLQNLTNRAVDMGLQLAKSLTIDQIGEGFREYELKMGSIRTIMANTEHEGTTLEQVKGSLEELNKYADLTIYNFGQMTDSIGRFTAAGVGIDDSTVAIKGMSNLAATSGATTHQLNSAMYQMSQALAAGKFNLMDWNSLVNSGMGGKITQDALVKTAKSMGKTIDMSEGFRESIRGGWLDSKVFLATMKTFAEDESMLEAATKIRTFTQLIDTVQEAIGSGLGMSFEHIFGDFEEATELFSTVGEAMTAWIDDAMDGFNQLVGAVADGGGFLNVFKGLGNILKPIGQLIGAIASGFARAFSSVSTDGVIKATEGFLKFTESLTMSQATTARISRIFELFFSGLKLGIDIVLTLAGAILKLVPPGLFETFVVLVSSVTDSIFRVAESIGKLIEASGLLQFFKDSMEVAHTWVSKLGDSIVALTSKFSLSGPAIANAMNMISSSIANGMVKSGEWISGLLMNSSFEGLRKIGETMRSLTTIFKYHYDETSSIFTALLNTTVEYLKYLNINFDSFSNFVKGVAGAIGNFLGPVWDLVKDIFSGLEFRHFLGGGFLVGVWGVVKKIIENMDDLDGVWKGIKDFIEVMKSNADKTNFLEGITSSLTEFSDSLKSAVSVGNIVAVSVAIGILAVSMKILEDLDTGQIIKGMAAIATSMATLSIGMKLLDGVSISGVGSVKIIAFAAAVKLMASTFDDVGSLSANQLIKGATALGTATAILVVAMKLLDGVKVGTGPVTMLAIAGTIKILVSVINDVVGIHRNHVVKGMGTIAILLAELAIFTRVMNGIKVNISTAIALAGVSATLLILVKVIEQLSGIHSNQIVKGMGSIAIILGELALFAFVMRGSRIKVSDAAGIAGTAGALLLIVEVIKRLSGIHSNQIVKGMGTIAILLGEIALFAFLTKGTNMISTGIGVTIIAGAINLLVPPLKELGEMRWKDLVKGLGTLAVALGALIIASKIASGTLLGAISITIMAASLSLLIKPIKSFTDMAWEDLVQGLLKLSLSLAAIAGVSMLLYPAVGPILAFSAAMVGFGLAVALIGGGLALFATGLVTLASLTATSVASILTAVEMLIDGLMGILDKIGGLIAGIITIGAKAIEESAEPMVRAVMSIIMALLRAFDDNIEEFIEKGTNIVLALMKGMEDNAEPLTEGGYNMAIALIDAMSLGLDEKGPELRQSIHNFVGELLVFFVETGVELTNIFLGWIPGVEGAVTQLGTDMTTAIREALGMDEEVDTTMKRAQGNIDNANRPITGRTGQVGKSASDAFYEKFLIDKYGEERGKMLINEINNTPIKKSGIGLANEGVSGFKSVNSSGAGANMASGFQRGMNNGKSSIWNTAWNLGKNALSAIKSAIDSRSPSKETEKEGVNFGMGLANGISKMGNKISESAKVVASNAVDTTNYFMDSLIGDMDREVHVRLVLDTSEVDSWTPGDLTLSRPDTSFTSRMVDQVQPGNNQNGNNNNMDTNESKEGDSYNYDVHIHATGELPRSTIKRMATQFKDELETMDRRDRINRGEEVVV